MFAIYFEDVDGGHVEHDLSAEYAAARFLELCAYFPAAYVAIVGEASGQTLRARECRAC